MDVAGVRLGATMAEAEAALKQAGWLVDRVRGDSWDDAIAGAVDRRRGTLESMNRPRTGVDSLKATKGEEFLTVQLHPTSSGGQVSGVNYTAPLGGRTLDQLRSELHRRYGAPTTESWSGTRGSATYTRAGRNGPRLAFFMEADGMHLSLYEGETARLAWQTSLDRAVNARIGAVGRSF